jgi:hypothetical protein
MEIRVLSPADERKMKEAEFDPDEVVMLWHESKTAVVEPRPGMML